MDKLRVYKRVYILIAFYMHDSDDTKTKYRMCQIINNPFVGNVWTKAVKAVRRKQVTGI